MRHRAFSRLTAVCALALLPVLGMAVFAEARAAAAVSVDARRGKMGYCAGEADSWTALSCAERECAKSGGRKCESIAGCPGGGYGAVARDKGRRAVGASCGKPDEEAAKLAAFADCRARGGRTGKCAIVGVFQDKSAAPEQTGQGYAPVKRVTKKAEPKPEPKPEAKGAPRSLAQSGSGLGERGGGTYNRPSKQPAGKSGGGAGKQPEAKPGPAPVRKPEPQPVARKQAGGEECEEDDEDCLQKKAGSASGGGAVQPGPQKLDPKFIADVANRLIGKWSTGDCATSRWEVIKYDDNLFKATFWSADVGMSGEDSFTLRRDGETVMMVWGTMIGARGKAGTPYIERIADIENRSYTVIGNNFAGKESRWTVRRCR